MTVQGSEGRLCGEESGEMTEQDNEARQQGERAEGNVRGRHLRETAQWNKIIYLDCILRWQSKMAEQDSRTRWWSRTM